MRPRTINRKARNKGVCFAKLKQQEPLGDNL